MSVESGGGGRRRRRESDAILIKRTHRGVVGIIIILTRAHWISMKSESKVLICSH